MDMRIKNILVPAVVFAAFAVLYITIALVDGNDVLFKPVWDIGHYQSIAERGYDVRPCDPAVDYPVGDICGNVGWFPAWPLVVKVLSLGQVSFGLKVFPSLFALIGFVLFYNLLMRLADGCAALIGTVALAATPAAFYFLTGFPYSFILALFTAYLYCLYTPNIRGRRYALPILALVISLSYPPAFLTAIIPLVLVVKRFFKKEDHPRITAGLKDLAYYLVPFALGPLLLSTYFYFKFDDFFLITHFQAKYYRNWAFPLTVVWQSLLQFPALYVENASFLFYGLTLLIFAPYRLKSELIAYFVLFLFFSPATGSITSVYRHYLLLFPAAMVIGTSPRPFWVKAVYIAVGFILSLLRFYPIFLSGRLI